LVEFGGTRILPLVLPADYVNIVAEWLPGFVEAMCRNEHFVGVLKTMALDWIAHRRTGPRDLHAINTGSH